MRTINIFILIILLLPFVTAFTEVLGTVTITTSTPIYPVTVTTHSPANNATVAALLNVSYTVINLNGPTTCLLIVNNLTEDSQVSNNNQTVSMDYIPGAAETGEWYLSCTGSGITGAYNTTTYTYQSAATIMNIHVRNIQTEEELTGVNITLTHTGTNVTTNYTNITSPLILTPDVGTYNISVSRDPYFPQSRLVSITSGQTVTEYFNLGFNSTFNLYDERTLTAFNMSSPDRITFQLFCPNSTIITEITNQSFSVPITCQYTKFRFVLDYGPTNYYRTFILNPDQLLNVNVYLIDLQTTTAIFNNFIIEDLLNDYDNPLIIIKKIIQNNTNQITGDYVDIENSVGAFLIENNEYIIEIHSDNQPVRIMGAYLADTAGDKSLRLYDISLLITTPSFTQTIDYSATIQNVSGNQTYIMIYDDTANRTDNVNIKLYTGSVGGTLIHEITVFADSIVDEFNVEPYINETLYSLVTIQHEDYGTMTDAKLMYENTKINLQGILQYLNPSFITWFLVILLSAIAIQATNKNATAVTIVIIAMVGLFGAFGLWPDQTIKTTLIGVIVLAVIVGIGYFLKSEDTPTV